jgi:hypothetical protein
MFKNVSASSEGKLEGCGVVLEPVLKGSWRIENPLLSQF